MADHKQGGAQTDGRSAEERRRFVVAFSCFSLLLVAVIGLVLGRAWMVGRAGARAELEADSKDGTDNSLAVLVDTEEWIIAQTPNLAKLSRGLLDHQLPDEAGRSLFSKGIEIRRPFEREVTASGVDGKPLESQWKTETETQIWPSATVQLWKPVLDGLTVLHARFHYIDVRYINDNPNRLDANVGFEGLAQGPDGEFVSITAKQRLRWENMTESGGGEIRWRIVQWEQQSLSTRRRDRLMFQDVLDIAIADSELAERFRMSEHEKMLLKIAKQEKAGTHVGFEIRATSRHPSLSVVDVDQDGWDDLYIMPRIGKNVLLRNRGDGTFVDIAAEVGLAVDSFCSGAVFADFDNDGDPDLVLGRSIPRSQFFINEGGKFVESSSERRGTKLPMLVTSVSAADYNGDGLLDVFFATGARELSRVELKKTSARGSLDEESGGLFRDFLSSEQARKAYQLRAGEAMLDRVGPPNLLLVNRGGRFEVAPENEQVELWKNSTQGTWGDYDNDGDVDLYVSNDHAMNTMLRNDGPDGFVDVTSETGTDDIGLGMGAAWGDYDNDNRLDLYVSNLNSTTGRRVTGKAAGLDKRLNRLAAGNSLFRNEGSKFTRTSGRKSEQHRVENAGRSWGSQFVDVNNDGFLDLYALSGLFTSPKEASIGLDLASDYWRSVVRRYTDFESAGATPDSIKKIQRNRYKADEFPDIIAKRSLAGRERNQFFLNGAGEFANYSGLSGLDNIADSRVFVTWDFDRDGWQDIALVNTNRPALNLYRNQLGDREPDGSSSRGRFVAVRFVGGNTKAEASTFAARDGYGAKLFVEAGELSLMREHRCGEGLAAQNSKTMLVGIGENDEIDSLAVQWPSGKRYEIENIKAGAMVTFFEDKDGAMSHAVSTYGK